MFDTLDQSRLANANLLIVEIGNSHVSLATLIRGKIHTNLRFEPDDLSGIVETAEAAWAGLPQDYERCVVIGSVVRATLAKVRDLLAKKLDTEIRVVGEEIHRPMSLATEQPERVGIDRVCAAAAAFDVLKKSCVIASFGTAVTIDCVNDEGVFMGGAILPGLFLQSKSLHEGTDALPQVAIEASTQVFGDTTEEAIRIGVVSGMVGALREIVERYATELGSWPQLVVTGGGAELIRSQCDFIDNVVPDLCIRGIALAHRKHFTPFEDEESE